MSDEQHKPFNQYECPRCRVGSLRKTVDLPIVQDRRFHCGRCGVEFRLSTYPPLVGTGVSWGSNYEENN